MGLSYGTTTYHVRMKRAASFRYPLMSETSLDLRHLPKPLAYTELATQIDSILIGITDDIAQMATVSSLVHHAFGFLWTGFYRVVSPGSTLRIGPYQGTLGCLEIPRGRGVCGTVAAQRRTIIVDDVSLFPGHIACDPRSKSEIVVPVFDSSGRLLAVMDVDADHTSAFGDDDRAGLELIVARFARPPLHELSR